MAAYYNEIDRFAADWLRNLIAAGQIAPGDVDERSIADVQPADLEGYTQCHFFAGIGGWSCALRLAGWPDEAPVWTGSCPCQPFSAAGKRKGTADPRHLWPQFRRLIAERRPPVCFGEQVARRAGREWLAGVRSDMEELGYAVGAADLAAASVWAPHIRQRLYWVADSKYMRFDKGIAGNGRGQESERSARREELARCSGAGWLADSSGQGLQACECQELPRALRDDEGRAVVQHGGAWSGATWCQCRDGRKRRIPTQPELFPLAHGIPGRVGRLRAYGNAIVPQVAAAFVRAALNSDSQAKGGE